MKGGNKQYSEQPVLISPLCKKHFIYVNEMCGYVCKEVMDDDDEIDENLSAVHAGE